MSVNDADPRVPNDDNGKGLRLIGWLLLIWTGVSMLAIPPWNWVSRYMPVVDILCFTGGLVMLGIGYWVAGRTPSAASIIEHAHDLAEHSEDGANQYDHAS
jgi:hypothetical protein